MVIKWIKGFIKHPYKIIKSIYYRIFNKEEVIARKRLSICNKCSNLESLSKIGNICGVCGCILENKTRLIEEKCEMNKW